MTGDSEDFQDSEDTQTQFEVGDYVVDFEATELKPDVGVVIRTPDATLTDWVINQHEVEDEDASPYTVADDNPNYNPESNVVLISFIESGLENRWPEWRSEYPDGLYDGVIEHGVQFFPFPENRLDKAQPENVAETLADT